MVAVKRNLHNLKDLKLSVPVEKKCLFSNCFMQMILCDSSGSNHPVEERLIKLYRALLFA